MAMICNDEILGVPHFQTSLDTFFAYSSYAIFRCSILAQQPGPATINHEIVENFRCCSRLAGTSSKHRKLWKSWVKSMGENTFLQILFGQKHLCSTLFLEANTPRFQPQKHLHLGGTLAEPMAFFNVTLAEQFRPHSLFILVRHIQNTISYLRLKVHKSSGKRWKQQITNSSKQIISSIYE